MHYYDEGVGDPMLFLHGIPTSAYLWRNIIPALSSSARCVAPDFMGMGKSEKPDINYTLSEHIAYLDAFIQQLDLKNITLVVHGWGSVIGLDYARRHPKNIKAISFYESFIHPVTEWGELSLPIQQIATLLKRPRASYRAVIEQNYFVEKILPRSAIRQLTEEEMNHYREPFKTPESRELIWQHITEMPFFEKSESKAMDVVQKYSAYLQKSPIPKLMLYAVPGFMTTMGSVIWCKENLPNIQLACLDDAMHLAQETMPEQFSTILLTWYKGVLATDERGLATM